MSDSAKIIFKLGSCSKKRFIPKGVCDKRLIPFSQYLLLDKFCKILSFLTKHRFLIKKCFSENEGVSFQN